MKPLLPPDYRPSEDEPFMNPMQREYFRQKLLKWRAELQRDTFETLVHLQEESLAEADLTDRATLETDRSLELRTRDRERKLIGKINEALRRIDDGSYGFCEETSEPISLRRLEARPIATLTIEAQERHERRERSYREE
jgi:DnaK suppressor protein